MRHQMLVYRKAFALMLLLPALTVAFAQDGSRGVGVPADEKGGAGNYNHIYAVVVGISQYQDRELNLHYADKDARLFADYLQSAYPGKLRLYENLKLLLDSVATFDRIQHELLWLRENCKKGDLAIFYFAGHGGVQVDWDRSREGYLLGYNAQKSDLNAGGTILVSKLDNLINDVIATQDGASVLCVLDACHAGTSHLFATSNEDINRRFINDPPGNVIRILSCNGTQSSMEKDKLCGGEGVFTYYLVKGLLSDTGGVMRLRDIRNYLESRVEAETNNAQTPQTTNANPNAVLRTWKARDAAVALNCLVGEDRPSHTDVPSSTPKTESEYLANQLTDLQKEHFNQFTTAMAQKRYIEPVRGSVIYYYKLLEEDRVAAPVLEQIKTQWKVQFENYAQSLIVDYVNELHISKYTDYENAAKMLDYCLSYSSPSDPSYNNLLSRKTWLECYSTNTKMLKGLMRISQNEARGIRLRLIEKLKGAIAIDSSAAYLRNTLGSLYENIGNNKEALIAYREAERLAPRWTYPRVNLSNVLEKWKDKIAVLDSCIVLNPKMYLAYGNLAYRYMSSKKTLDLAEKNLDLAKKICLENGEQDNDDLAWIYKEYGYLYVARQMKQQAEANFRKAIEIYGDSAGSYRAALADFYSNFNEFDKSKAEIDKALTINPNDAVLYASMGYRLLKMERRNEAIQWYRKAISLDSTEDDYHYNIAYLYRVKGDYQIDSAAKYTLFDSARQEIDRALTLDPNSGNNLSEKAILSALMKDTVTAEKYYAKCLEVDPENSYIYYSMSYLYQDKDIEKAKDLMRKAIEIMAPEENAGYYVHLGELYSTKKDYTQTLYYDTKAVSVNPRETENIVKVSEAYYLLNKPDSAVAYADKGVENELLVQNVQAAGTVDYLKNRIRETNWKFYYYCLGSYYEGLWAADKKRENLNLAVRWYTYAGNLFFAPALYKLQRLAAIEKRNDLQPLTDRLSKVLTGQAKVFYIPCLFPDSVKRSVSIYINDFPANPVQVLEEESNRIRDVFQARIPDAVIEAFNKLYKIAADNKVSFVELCVYALGTANKAKSEKSGTGTDKDNQSDDRSGNRANEKDHTAESENYANSQNEEVRIIYEIRHGQTQNLSARMRPVIAKRTGVDLNNFDESVSRLKQALKEDTASRDLIDYYALGYVYENTSGHQDLAQARKWYGYAFQMGYSPAYFKLDSLYQFWSKSKQAWLKENYEAEYYAIRVPVEENRKWYTIYLMEFPPDDANPIGHEADRLRDVFGVTIKSSTITDLNDLYVRSGTYRMPFVSQVEYAIYFAARDSLNPDKTNLWYWFEMGNKSLKAKNYPEAIGLYKKALDINARNTMVLNQLGLALTYNKDFDEGIATFDKMIDLDRRTTSTADYNKACNYSLRNNTADALKWLDRAFAAGYRDMKNVQADEDLINIRNTDAYKALLKKYSH